MGGDKSLRIGFIGYGYWGPNLVRNFADTEGCSVAMICDHDRARLRVARRRYPAAALTVDPEAILADPFIEAVVIATPVNLHFAMAMAMAMAMAALKRGKYVLIEKPLTHSMDEAARLVDEAAQQNLVLLVDHTFVFTSSVNKLHEMIDNRFLGDLYYFDSIRTNLGRFRNDVNVFWDVAVHDLSIL